MKMSLEENELQNYIKKQVSNFFPDGIECEGNDVDEAFKISLKKIEECCSHINFRHFFVDGEVNFIHTYSDQYSMFLYIFSRTLWELSENKNICDKLVLLNRTLHGILVPYTVVLPKIFLFAHTEGTILGNVEYDDYLVVLQNVTVNTSDNVKIGKGVFLSAGAKIIGDCKIGNRVSVGVNTVVYNTDVEDDMIIYTDSYGKIIQKKRNKICKASDYFLDLNF